MRGNNTLPLLQLFSGVALIIDGFSYVVLMF